MQTFQKKRSALGYPHVGSAPRSKRASVHVCSHHLSAGGMWSKLNKTRAEAAGGDVRNTYLPNTQKLSTVVGRTRPMHGQRSGPPPPLKLLCRSLWVGKTCRMGLLEHLEHIALSDHQSRRSDRETCPFSRDSKRKRGNEMEIVFYLREIVFYLTATLAAFACFFAFAPFVLLLACLFSADIWDDFFGEGRWMETAKYSLVGWMVLGVCIVCFPLVALPTD
jgi:hypothetical protein